MSMLKNCRNKRKQRFRESTREREREKQKQKVNFQPHSIKIFKVIGK